MPHATKKQTLDELKNLLSKALPDDITVADIEIVDFHDMTLTAFTFLVAGFVPAITLTYRRPPPVPEVIAAIRAVTASLRLAAWTPKGGPH